MSTIERILKPDSSNKNKILTVTGVSGSGKDYLVDLAQKTAPDLIGNNISIFRFGSELLRTINNLRPDDQVASRDLLKLLSPSVLDQYIQFTLEELIRQQPALCLTHIVAKQQGRLVVNPNSEKFVNGKEYVFIESDPEMIQQWRAQEQGIRQRETETISDINLHQNVAKLSTMALAMSLGMGYMVIHNDPDNTDISVNALLEEASSLL